MNRRPTVSSRNHILAGLLALGAVHQTAAWPEIQAVIHAFLVLGLAPEFRSPLVGAIWAAAAGWLLEGSLRMYPRLGGTPLANMIICLLATWTLTQWPPRRMRPYWARLGVFTVLHILLVHGAVHFTAGSHAWGYGPVWTILLVPVWGAISFKFYVPHYRE